MDAKYVYLQFTPQIKKNLKKKLINKNSLLLLLHISLYISYL